MEKWDSFAVGFGAASAAVVGQNLGAGQVERARTAAWVGVGYALVPAVAMALLMLLVPAQLADLFTDDAVYVDPAWGRIEGVDAIREFMIESMTGLEDWRFPILFTAIDGDYVAVKWTQILPGTRPDGSHYTQSGVSTLVYGGGGKFRYGEDLLKMVHVLDELRESKWRPGPGAKPPPAAPAPRW